MRSRATKSTSLLHAEDFRGGRSKRGRCFCARGRLSPRHRPHCVQHRAHVCAPAAKGGPGALLPGTLFAHFRDLLTLSLSQVACCRLLRITACSFARPSFIQSSSLLHHHVIHSLRRLLKNVLLTADESCAACQAVMEAPVSPQQRLLGGHGLPASPARQLSTPAQRTAQEQEQFGVFYHPQEQQRQQQALARGHGTAAHARSPRGPSPGARAAALALGPGVGLRLQSPEGLLAHAHMVRAHAYSTHLTTGPPFIA